MIPRHGAAPALCLSLLLAAPAAAQEDESVEARLERLETENRELARRLDLLAEEQEGLTLGGLVGPVPDAVPGQRGHAPSAAKVFSTDEGISLGGYGEALYRARSGSASDELDFLRAILYFGYRFNERWIFNSEIEFEHASTGESGDASVEFAYLEYLASETLSFRAGLLLLPLGFVNELHEPPTFLGALRPETERRIIPTTFRENGAGVLGDAGPFEYRAYVTNGFDATGFTAGGLRGGRQKGSQALAEDLAVSGRLDWVETPGLLAGVSAFHGDSGQGQAGLGGTDTTIVDVHVEWRWRGLWTRGLWAQASVDDVAALNSTLGLAGTASVGERLEGGYLEAGYDVAPLFDEDASYALRPYARYETIDTQAEVPSGFARDPQTDFDVLSFGLNVQPIEQLVFKLEYQDLEHGPDGINLAMGYAF